MVKTVQNAKTKWITVNSEIIKSCSVSEINPFGAHNAMNINEILVLKST
jgi:hypothetical protein